MKCLGAACLALGACTFEAPQLDDPAAAQALAVEVEAQNLMPWVERLATDHLADARLSCDGYPAMDQYPSCELSSAAAIELVHATLSGLGYRTRIVTHGPDPDGPRNVVAELRGTAHPDEVVVIAAHLDAFYAGADDNSSGVAAMLEVARVAAGHRFERTVRFVGFDLEERGSLGSTRYVESGAADDVVAALVLECVGFTDRRANSQDSPLGLQLGEVGDSLAVAANDDSQPIARTLFAVNNSLALVELRAVIAGGDGAYPLTGALLRSDNGPFWLRGLPAVMLTDTANYRNPRYHGPDDLPETLDPALLAGTTRLVAAALAVLARVQP